MDKTSVQLTKVTFLIKILYKNETYELQANEYVRYGSLDDLEGEVEFWDYRGTNDNESLISLAVLPTDGKRADVVSHIIILTIFTYQQNRLFTKLI